MFKFHKFIIAKKWFLFLLILIIGVFAYISYFDKKNELTTDFFTQSLAILQERIEKRWILGDREGAYEQSSKAVHSSFFECNPYYINQFLKSDRGQNELKITVNGVDYLFQYESYSFDLKYRFILSLKENKTKKVVNVRLLNSCRDTYLVQNIYQTGQYKQKGEIWDNYSREIFIDKYYVTNLDVHIWKQRSFDMDFEQAYRPSVNLSLEEKKAYCSSRGAHLLQSHIFDAASFIPNSDPRSYIFLYPYPWTKKRDIKDIETSKLCNHFYFKECSNYQYHSPYAASWNGVFHTLGSFEEVLDSKFNNLNLKLSSRELTRTSRAHQIGFRVKLKDGAFGAFRCMEEK